MIVRIFVLLALFAQASCATNPASVKDVMLPLAVVRKIVMDNVPGGMKKQSLNGREITGEYFNARNLDEPSNTAPHRATATIVILGSRRPYVLSVTVVLESRRKGSRRYEKRGPQPKLAKLVVKRLEEALANRPADINIIDEFRAF